MKVLTKAQANKEIVNSLFRKGGTLDMSTKVRFDLGKYKKGIIGTTVKPAHERWAELVWAERRQDKNGPYYALFCLTKDVYPFNIK